METKTDEPELNTSPPSCSLFTQLIFEALFLDRYVSLGQDFCNQQEKVKLLLFLTLKCSKIVIPFVISDFVVIYIIKKQDSLLKFAQ